MKSDKKGELKILLMFLLKKTMPNAVLFFIGCPHFQDKCHL